MTTLPIDILRVIAEYAHHQSLLLFFDTSNVIPSSQSYLLAFGELERLPDHKAFYSTQLMPLDKDPIFLSRQPANWLWWILRIVRFDDYWQFQQW
jgi:hypothetical protein